MNEPENTLQDLSETADLKQQVAELTRQTGRLFVGLVIVSLMLASFVGLQARRADKDLDQIRPQATQLLEANKKEAPAIQGFVSQLGVYGQGHPDYAEKVLAKYGIKPGAAASTGAVSPVAAPKK
jgi:hypothetical protein